MLKKKVAGYDS